MAAHQVHQCVKMSAAAVSHSRIRGSTDYGEFEIVKDFIVMKLIRIYFSTCHLFVAFKKLVSRHQCANQRRPRTLKRKQSQKDPCKVFVKVPQMAQLPIQECLDLAG